MSDYCKKHGSIMFDSNGCGECKNIQLKEQNTTIEKLQGEITDKDAAIQELAEDLSEVSNAFSKYFGSTPSIREKTALANKHLNKE